MNLDFMLTNITIPVHDEERRLPRSLPRLHRFLHDRCPFEFEIVIADNASTDRTPEIARELAEAHDRVRVLRLEEKGRGRALKKAWGESDASILSYMDVDLSTDLQSFPALIEAVAIGGFDVAIGSRLLQESSTTRGWKRELISRCYNRMIRMVCGTRFRDAQCGFKALTHEAATRLLPLVEDNGWFFDTELLILAEKLGWRLYELPVRWLDDSDSHVKIWRTAVDDLKGLVRVRRNLFRRAYPVADRSADDAMRMSEMSKSHKGSRPNLNVP
jgi:glycosyltransferase involved in cell wall biosynthesis